MAKRISGEMAYPLAWPSGQARRKFRQPAKFKATLVSARTHLLNELKLLGARYVVISTNVPTRNDGLPYANMRQPDDPAVAVYFDLDGEQTVFACDKWNKIEHNLRAVGKTIESIRGITRWGSSEMMKRAMSSFKALPSDGSDWRATLGFESHFARSPTNRSTTLALVKERYRERAMRAHPDRGGSVHEMTRLNTAWEAAQKELS
jgi:hypothetical protein